jgi:sulfatase modifying factor 1
MSLRRTSSNRKIALGFLVVASASCNAIGGLGEYRIVEPDIHHCGVNQEEECNTSLLVDGGTFTRNCDQPSCACVDDPRCKDGAKVDAFKLDKFEVTVGRFRMFVDDVVGGWRPTVGSGKHAHVNGGKGLRDGGIFEPGWVEAELRGAKSEWDVNLTDVGKCANHTWTPTPGANEKKPINCVTWTEAYAFCIWDHGFLPSEAEWDFAAAGGANQWRYPWGAEAPGLDARLANYGCFFDNDGGAFAPDATIKTCEPVLAKNIAPVGSILAGKGKWGQLDLAGNLAEWTLDFVIAEDEYTFCDNCMYGPESKRTGNPVTRGGSFDAPESSIRTTFREGFALTRRAANLGFRCARSP